jgi:hypothetical protein
MNAPMQFQAKVASLPLVSITPPSKGLVHPAGVLPCEFGPAARRQEENEGRLGIPKEAPRYDFREIRIYADASRSVQPKPAIHQTSDKYEREANRIADQVMRGLEPVLQDQTVAGEDLVQTEPMIQRQLETEGEGDEALLEDKPLLHRQVNNGMNKPSTAPPVVRDVARSPGLPLDPATRKSMELCFGCDLSQVRVHDDALASKAAQSMNARAFTVGNDVVFGPGEYVTGTAAGQQLLAHELTHVIQQGKASQVPSSPNGIPGSTRPVFSIADFVTRVQPVCTGNEVNLIQRAEGDNKVTGKYEWKKTLSQRGRASRYPRVFFELAMFDLDDEQKEIVLKPIVRDHEEDDLVLNGFASEDEMAEDNTGLIASRLHEVDSALRDLGRKRNPKTVPKPEESYGQIDYRYWRAVEIEFGTPEPGSENRTEECPVLYPDFEARYATTMEQALDTVKVAQKALKRNSKKTEAQFKRVFFTTNRGDIETVKVNLGKIETQLELFSDLESNRVQCGTKNDPVCNKAGGAYVDGYDKGEESKMTLCPPDPFDGETLIHESAHAAKDFGTKDHAYRHESLIYYLTTEQAMENTDSYVVLIQLLNAKDPSEVTFGSPNPVRSGPSITSEEDEKIKETVAWVQSGITTLYPQTAALYGVLHESIVAGRWTNDEYQNLMKEFAPLFGLTEPPSLPKESDKWGIAAIYDRLQKMRDALISSPISGFKTTGSGDPADPFNAPSWYEGPGSGFTVDSDFFTKDLPERVRDLLTLLVKATPGISSDLVPSYVEAVAVTREFMKLAWPLKPK